jgi:hypothetical protein
LGCGRWTPNWPPQKSPTPRTKKTSNFKVQTSKFKLQGTANGLDLRPGLGDGSPMNGMAIATEVSEHPPGGEGAARDLASYWINRCDDFMERQRKNIIERDPSPQALAEHLETLKFMIRVTLSLQALLADPDFPVRHLAAKVAGKLLQLEESLKLLQNPVTDAQADAILQAAYRDGPGTGRTA